MTVPAALDAPQEALSTYLVQTAASFPGEKTTVRAILDRVGERGMMVLCVFLCVPFMVPVSIPGVSTVFGFAITLAGLAVSSKKLPWLPRRMLEKEVQTASLRKTFEAGAKKLARLEKLLKPRVQAVASLVRLNGLALAFAGVLLMAPFGLVPFSNTLPALAAMFLALGMLHRDGAFVLAGYATTLGTLVYFGVLIAGAIYGGMELGEMLR